jgi:hypothetical protein
MARSLSVALLSTTILVWACPASASDEVGVSVCGSFQTQFEHLQLDLVGEPGATQDRFLIRRGRLTAEIEAYHLVDATFQAAFDKGTVSLKDYYADFPLWSKDVKLRLGQTKTPFTRHFPNSGFRQEFVDRAITHAAFGAHRDVGLMLHNDYTRSPWLEYALGVFNGTGDTSTLSAEVLTDVDTGRGTISNGRFSNVPTTFRPTVVGRLGLNTGDIAGYSEADLEGGGLRLSLAASGIVDLDQNEDNSETKGEIDAVIKFHGLSLVGETLVSYAETDSSPSDRRFQAWGFRTQAGYVIAGRYQPAVRYAFVDPSGEDNNLHEIQGAFSVYLHGHSLKWQTDASVILSEDPAGARQDMRIRTQVGFVY